MFKTTLFYLLLNINNLLTEAIITSFHNIPPQVYQSINNSKEPSTHSLNSGILGIYAGFYQFSNKDGLIALFKKHSGPSINILITPDIDIVHPFGKTAVGLRIPKQVALKEPAEKNNKSLFAKKYTFTKSSENDNALWNIEESAIESPEIDKSSFILLENPDNLIISTGSAIYENDDQLILPQIYIDGETRKQTPPPILKFFDKLNFFQRLDTKISINEERWTKSQISDSYASPISFEQDSDLEKPDLGKKK